MIFPVRLVPRLPLLREHDLIRAHETREHSAGDVRREVDFLFEIAAAGRFVGACRPLGRADRDDEARGDEERRPHLGPVRLICVAADVEAHSGSIAKKRRIRASRSAQSSAAGGR
jgi:hypothetical protein